MSKLLTVKEVCEFFGVSRGTAMSWIRNGKLRAFKIGGGRLWRVRESELKRFMRQGHEPK
jgi:excisionase family DNA binding protein